MQKGGEALLLISHMHVLKLCTLAHITIIAVMSTAWTLIDWLRQMRVIWLNPWVSAASTNKRLVTDDIISLIMWPHRTVVINPKLNYADGVSDALQQLNDRNKSSQPEPAYKFINVFLLFRFNEFMCLCIQSFW